MIIFCLITVALLVGADQIIKLLIIKNFNLFESVSVIKFGKQKIFDLTYTLNDGAGWSIFSGKRIFLILITSVFMIGVIIFLIKNAKSSKFLTLSMLLIISGGVGNLIDRIFRNGKVVDYIETKFMNFPIFNFADICVVIGAIMFLVYILFIEKSHNNKAIEEIKSEGETNE